MQLHMGKYDRILLVIFITLGVAFGLSPAAEKEDDEKWEGGLPKMTQESRVAGQPILFQNPRPIKGGSTGSGIKYIREKIEKFKYPEYKGEWYETSIPDTLDITER